MKGEGPAATEALRQGMLLAFFPFRITLQPDRIHQLCRLAVVLQRRASVQAGLLNSAHFYPL